MTCPSPSVTAALGAAALLTAALALCSGTAMAADVTPAARPSISPDQPKPRQGSYRIVSRGANVIHAKCLEGGNVVVPTRRAATAAERDRAIHDACKSVDYTK
jgi:hypothetical protein